MHPKEEKRAEKNQQSKICGHIRQMENGKGYNETKTKQTK